MKTLIILIIAMTISTGNAAEFNAKYSTNGEIGAEIQMYGSAKGNGVFGIDFDLADFNNVTFNTGFEFKRKDFDFLAYYGVGLVKYKESSAMAISGALKGGIPACPPAKQEQGKCKASNAGGNGNGSNNGNGGNGGGNNNGNNGGSGGTGGGNNGTSGGSPSAYSYSGQRVKQELGARLTFKKLGKLRPFVEANVSTTDSGFNFDKQVNVGLIYNF